MSNISGEYLRSYEIRDQIGAGGFGRVYRAFQPVVGRDVAIKSILPQYANDTEFIRRFEFEAQVVARLEHLHIVPLYDYWRDPNGAYLVMRWLPGSLRRALTERAFTVPETLSLLADIGSALDFAHRRNIIHRDIKPENILLDEDNNGYLTDFGIAKNIGGDLKVEKTKTLTGFLVGSPAYITPEQINGDPVSAQTDLYSFGLVVYEILTRQPPFPSTLSAYEILSRHLYEQVPLVRNRIPDVPPAVDEVIQTATSKDPANRYPTAVKMIAALREAFGESPAINIVAPRAAPAGVGEPTYTPSSAPSGPIENPYKGLRPFEEADAADFFGREELVKKLEQRFQEADPNANFLAVVGPSGSGKSSVVLAGLIPALRRGALPGSQNWFIQVFTPSQRLLDTLTDALLHVAAFPIPDLRERLEQDVTAFSDAIKRALPTGTTLLLVIDQFEEVFTMSEGNQQQAAFLNNVLYALKHNGDQLRVIVTLRADFYDRPLMYPEFGDLMRQRTEVILPLSRSELVHVISKPAERVGIALEPRLLDAVLQDVAEQPSALPLLQYTLTELFEHRTGRQITLSAYEQIGGVTGSLARRADEIYGQLPPEKQEGVRQLFLRLVTPGEGTEDTRRRVPESELYINGQNTLTEIVNIYTRYRLLTLDRDAITREPTVEVAHEALIRTWGRMHTWLTDSREDLRLQRRLAMQAQDWILNKRNPSYLPIEAQLAQYEAWAQRSTVALNTDEQALITAAIERREREQQAENERKAREAVTARRAQNFERAAIVLALVGVLAVIAIVIAVIQSQDAFANVRVANTQVAGAQSQAAVANNQATSASNRAAQAYVQATNALNVANSEVATANAQVAEAQSLAATANLQATNAQQQQITAVAQAKSAQNQQVTAIAQAQVAQNAAATARVQAEALRLAGLAEDQAAHPDVSALLAIRSLNIAYSPQAESALLKASEFVNATIFSGHTASVKTAAISPDNKWVVTASEDGTMRRWDAATGKEVARFDAQYTKNISDLSFSPDGKYVVSDSDNDTVLIWDANSGTVVKTLTAPDATLYAPTYSPDGQYLLTASSGKSSSAHAIIQWKTADWSEVKAFPGGTDEFNSIAFSPDGGYFVTTTTDVFYASIWSLSDNTSAIVNTGQHISGVNSAVFSSDDKYILTGGDDGTARLWDATTGAAVHVFPKEIGSVAADYSSDGRYIVTGSLDGETILYDADSYQELRRDAHSGGVNSVSFSTDAHYVLTASGDNTAHLWPVSSGTGIGRLIGHTDYVYAVDVSPDGRTLLTAGRDDTIRLWDAATGTEIRTILAQTSAVNLARFSPNGNLIASGGWDNALRLSDLDGRQLESWDVGSVVNTLAFSPDGQYIVTGDNNSNIDIWQIGNDTPVRKISSTEYVYSVAFSKDGAQLYTVGGNDLQIWDFATGKRLATYPQAANFVAVSPDNKTVALASQSSDGKIYLIDVASNALKQTLTGHGAAVRSVAFSPDGRYLVSGGDDSLVIVHNLENGSMQQFAEHTGAVWDVAFAPDSRHILSGSWDKTAQYWSLDYHDTIQAMCAGMGHDLSTSQREKFNITDNSPTCLAAQPSPTPTPGATVVATLAPTFQALAAQDAQRDADIKALDPSANRVCGPHSGSIAFEDGYYLSFDCLVSIRDFVGETTFTVPYDTSVGKWDFGIYFRSRSFNNQYKLMFFSDKSWNLVLGPPNNLRTLASGPAPQLNDQGNATNTIQLVVKDLSAQFSINGQPAGKFDLPDVSQVGDVGLIAGYYSDDKVTGKQINYSDFRVWATASDPNNQALVDARQADLDVRSLAPNAFWLYGPENGQIAYSQSMKDNHKIASPGGTGLNLRDFVVEAHFTNPYDPSTGQWDYGFGFRPDVNGAEYRVVVESDNQWILSFWGQLGNTRLATGKLDNLDTSANGTNFVRVVVYGETGQLYVNNQFVSDLALGTRLNSGDVELESATFDGNLVVDHTLGYQGFSVWSLPSYVTPAQAAALAQQDSDTTEVKALDSNAVLGFEASSGDLKPTSDSAASVDSNAYTQNFIAQSRVIIPDSSKWDYGFIFRDAADGTYYRLDIDGQQGWQLIYRKGQTDSTRAKGQVPTLDAGKEAVVRLLVKDKQALLFINNTLVGAFTLDDTQESGDVYLYAGYFNGNYTVHYNSFTMWSINPPSGS